MCMKKLSIKIYIKKIAIICKVCIFAKTIMPLALTFQKQPPEGTVDTVLPDIFLGFYIKYLGHMPSTVTANGSRCYLLHFTFEQNKPFLEC